MVLLSLLANGGDEAERGRAAHPPVLTRVHLTALNPPRPSTSFPPASGLEKEMEALAEYYASWEKSMAPL